jgi:transposase
MEQGWQLWTTVSSGDPQNQVRTEFIYPQSRWQPQCCKKGGEAVAYQGRKKAKTSNIIPLTDANGYIIATSEAIAGNHNDSYHLLERLKSLFRQLDTLDLSYDDGFFNADSAFDAKEARKLLWNRGVRPNIPENKRNRKRSKRGRKRHFNKAVYKKRFVNERTFAWVDKFKRLLVRFERKNVYWMGFHLLAFTLINLRDALVKV